MSCLFRPTPTTGLNTLPSGFRGRTQRILSQNQALLVAQKLNASKMHAVPCHTVLRYCPAGHCVWPVPRRLHCRQRLLGQGKCRGTHKAPITKHCDKIVLHPERRDTSSQTIGGISKDTSFVSFSFVNSGVRVTPCPFLKHPDAKLDVHTFPCGSTCTPQVGLGTFQCSTGKFNIAHTPSLNAVLQMCTVPHTGRVGCGQ